MPGGYLAAGRALDHIHTRQHPHNHACDPHIPQRWLSPNTWIKLPCLPSILLYFLPKFLPLLPMFCFSFSECNIYREACNIANMCIMTYARTPQKASVTYASKTHNAEPGSRGPWTPQKLPSCLKLHSLTLSYPTDTGQYLRHDRKLVLTHSITQGTLIHTRHARQRPCGHARGYTASVHIYDVVAEIYVRLATPTSRLRAHGECG